ncbi:VOC family protein [Simplicispira lacusdiani]|uniref:VOC family protein n=1 Tax=Simplicispira lacusdiani TaxID=2213010 RepID=UPI001E64D9E7|nr:VOC family protein [Simplicispira lacusdiani]
MSSPAPCVDHLVVLAADLASGAAWCERTLGVAPAAGGEHPLMGTHNRLLNISSPAHPRAYLEIIAINPGAIPAIPTGHKRWFDMDSEALRAQVARHGPQLIHWVAAVPDAAAAHAALAAQGLERGEILRASRATPQGLLQWRITVRPDGQRLLDGCLPTLIEWGEHHPCDTLPASGATLQSLALQHPDAAVLGAACQALGLGQLPVGPGPQPHITATLATPRGPVTLLS